MYGDDNNIEECFEFVRDGMWRQFLTLKYPREVGPKYVWKRYDSPDDAFEVWMDEMTQEHGGGENISYVRVIERKDTGDVLLHILLPWISAKYCDRHWKWRWYELCGGAAWDRKLDDRIEGLIKYFFYSLRCDIEYSDCGYPTLCRARETAG
jgi:hypothetical protein